MTKHTSARVWGDILWRFFAHKVSVCLLKITLIQWSDLPCTSLQKLTRLQCLWYQNMMYFLATKRILIFQNTQKYPKIKHGHFSHPSDQLHFTQPPFQKNARNKECQEQRMPVFWSSIFITAPSPKFNLGFQSKLKCFLKAGHTFLTLRFVPYPCTLSSNELIILSLDAGSASDVEILGLKVRIVQLFWSLGKKHSGRVKLRISWLWKINKKIVLRSRENGNQWR